MAPSLASAQPDDSPPPQQGKVEVSETGSYVVLMADDPLAAIADDSDQIQALRGGPNERQLRAQHRRAAQEVGVEIVNDYTVALNGFSGAMSHEQAEALQARDDVALVVPDYWREATTDASPDFLGLTGEGGAYDLGVDGEGVIVGVIDTGIWPEHPSFADDGTYESPDGVAADLPCEFGNTEHNPEDAPFECNNKLLGARQTLPTYRALIGAEDFEFDSARDDNGHGTHTASTAAGNAGVDAFVTPHDLGEVSGIAPRAHVIAYKGLGDLGGFSSDLAGAVNQAVIDGVDVINYSIGGGATLIGADDIAFLFAADAGVHVATSSGNAGPGASTIGGPASVPWITSVGASTQPRFFAGTVELGNGETYTGASLTGGVGTAPIVDAADVSKDEAIDAGDLCVPGELIRGQVRGKIVLCRRGAIARVDKSLAVAQAGGVGMIMYENDDSGDLFTDTHHVPSVHVNNSDGLAIKDYIAQNWRPGRSPRHPQATARIFDTGAISVFDPAPSMTSFSSRGPNPAAADIIKPDLTAPGHQILAGASPYADPNGNDFQSISGTSMSSPHVAGLFGLLVQAHPDWSPAMTKSALMTTSSQDVRHNDQTTPAHPFDMGAGHVDPGSPAAAGSAFDPGLVYDADLLDYFGFLCDMAPEIFIDAEATCGTLDGLGVPITATDLNVPSIGISSVPGAKTVTRTVTSVADSAQTYTPSIDAPDGFDVSVSPATLEVPAGGEATFEVTITTTDAAIGEWRFGSLTWVSGPYEVYSPIAARASLLEAPAELEGSGESGSFEFDVAFGYTGPYTAGAHGLEAATVFVDEVDQDPTQTFDPDGDGVVRHDVEVDDGALLRVAIPPDGVDDPEHDIDLFVLDSAGNLVASSTVPGTDEQVDIELPEDDTYSIYIHGWLVIGGTTTVTTYMWLLSADPDADDGSLEVSGPDQAVIGEVGTIQADWSGATDDAWYLGAVSHSDGDGILDLTVLNIDNR